MWNEKKTSPPVDRGNAVGLIIFILGVGTLLPWNFFITATEYFNGRLLEKLNSSSNSSTADVTEYNFNSWMALLSQLPLLLFTLLNSCLYQHVKERVRVSLSLVSILLLFGLTAALVQVHMDPGSFFSITMATIWFINMFGAVLQGSLFGLVGLFPPRYSTFFMSGQGLAGIFAAVAMLLSTLSNADSSSAALGYFLTPCVATFVTLICYLLLPHLDFARFYMSHRLDYEPEISKELLNVSGAKAKALEAGGGLTMEDRDSQRLSVFAVFKKIWPMALCVSCVFAVTLSVFPVITVRVKTVYKENQAWEKVFTCVCCFIVFNVFDLVGRSAPYFVQWPGKQSRLFPAAVLARVAFVPLLMMCNVEHSKLCVLFRHDAAFVLLMALFSFTNGYLASLCMAYAPQFVRSKDAETAGSLMTFFLVLGLALGAALSFLLGTIV